jgi:hypothetical protein
MQGEDIDQPGEGRDPQHLLLRRGEQQLTPARRGQVPPAHQRCHAAGIDELQGRQIDNDLWLPDRDRPRAFPRERGTNKNNNGLMEMLPEKGGRRKFPATWKFSGWAVDSLYHRPPGKVKLKEPSEMFSELMHQEAVIPPA